MIKYLIFLMAALASCTYSQSFSIYGKVTDAEGKALPGVNVTVQGLNSGDATGLDGNYEIKGLQKGNYIVRFSMIGFSQLKKEVILLADSKLDAVLSPEAFKTEQVIVSAGKHEQTILNLPVSADLLENKELLRYNHTNIRDAFKYVSGINLVDDQMSIRGSSGYSRGAGARVLVAIDGIPFYTGDTGEIIWEAIPVDEVDRVEIIKGASSSLYGSTAIGGVINVITKEVTQPFTYLKSFIGSYDKPSHEIWDWSSKYRLFNGQTVSHSNLIGRLSFSGSLTRLEDLGYKKNSFNKRYIGYLKTGFKISESSGIRLILNSVNQKSGNFIYWKNSRQALEPPDSDIGQTVQSDRYMAGLVYNNRFTEEFELFIRGSFYNTRWSDETSSSNISDADQLRGDVQSNYHITNNFLMINGFEVSRSAVSSNLFGSPNSIGAGAYTQLEYTLDIPLILTAGARYDFNQVNGDIRSSAVSPKFGFNYRVSSELSFRGMLGTGFRAPSLAEKYTSTFVSGIRVKPNPNVKPESNITFETGILFRTDYFLIDAAVFRNGYYDMIEPFIDPADGQITFANLVRARIQGVELSLEPRISEHFLLNLSYTYMHPKDLNSGKTLKYRPKHLFYSSFSYLTSGFESGLNFRYWSKFDEIDFELVELGLVPDGDKRVPVYVVDFNTGYNFLYIGFPGRVYLNIKNVLNYNYIELIGNIAPLRNIALSFEFFL